LGYPAGERLPKSNLDVWQHIAEPEKHPGTWNSRRMDQPGIVGVVDGVAHWVDRLKAAGNGQVPSVAKLAWETLKEE